MWTMLKTIFDLENFIIHQVPSLECCIPLRKVMNTKLQWMRENIFFRKKFIKYLMLQHVLNTKKKVIFSRKIIIKHEQNVVKCGLNIIPARDVKMR